MRPYWFGAVALAVVLLFVGFGYADKTRLHWLAEDSPAAPPPAADRVVGVERHCESGVGAGTTNLFSQQHPLAVAICDDAWDQFTAPAPAVSRYLEIIVRTQAGTIYRIQVPATTKVSLNDEWPPK